MICVDCGATATRKRCLSCAGAHKFVTDPMLLAMKLEQLRKGRQPWIANLRMTYLTKLIGAPKTTYTAMELAKIAYTAFQDGRKGGYTAGYMQARRRLSGDALRLEQLRL